MARLPPAAPVSSGAHPAAKGAGVMPSSASGPDPRILDWVLGNRGSLTDRGALASPSQIGQSPAHALLKLQFSMLASR